MARAIAKDLELDTQVVELVRRVGALPSPGNHITKYSVDRDVAGPTIVTVQFIADELFSKVTEKETDNG